MSALLNRDGLLLKCDAELGSQRLDLKANLSVAKEDKDATLQILDEIMTVFNSMGVLGHDFISHDNVIANCL